MINLKLKINAETNERIFFAKGNEEDFICSKCRTKIMEGFLCNNKSLCIACQNKTKMSKCKHNDINEHHHIKFIKQ